MVFIGKSKNKSTIFEIFFFRIHLSSFFLNGETLSSLINMAVQLIVRFFFVHPDNHQSSWWWPDDDLCRHIRIVVVTIEDIMVISPIFALIYNGYYIERLFVCCILVLFIIVFHFPVYSSGILFCFHCFYLDLIVV